MYINTDATYFLIKIGDEIIWFVENKKRKLDRFEFSRAKL